MAIFQYKARTVDGDIITGTVEVPSKAILNEIMLERQLILLEAHEKKFGRLQIKNITIFGTGIKSKEIVIFARQLSVLISATVPIVRALRILTQQTESKQLQLVVQDIADQVDGGARLSAAMHKHDKVFDDFFVYMIRAGETTGGLDDVLEYLADQKEKDYALVSKIVSSMIYPAFIVVVLIGIGVFMMIFVIPRLLDIISQSGGELPLVTRILVGTSAFMTNYWWVLLLTLFLAIGGYFIARRKPAGRHFLDQVKLRVPVIGAIFHKVYLARISQSLSNLLASGVPINRSMLIVADVVGNNVFKAIMQKAVADVEGGKSISESLGQSSFIPPMMSQMMSIGEETGRLDQILEKLSDFYIGEVESLTNALVSLIEPMIIILLGAGALLLVSGVMLPIYQVSTSI